MHSMHTNTLLEYVYYAYYVVMMYTLVRAGTLLLTAVYAHSFSYFN